MKKIKVDTKKLIIILGILVIIMMVVIIAKLAVHKNEEVNDEFLGSINATEVEFEVNPENLEGICEKIPVKKDELNEKIQNFCLYFLKNLYYSLEEVELESEEQQFYNEKLESIKEYMYNSSFDNFKRINKELNKITEVEMLYTKSIIYVDSLENTESYGRFRIDIVYNDNYTFEFWVYINYENDNKISFQLDY